MLPSSSPEEDATIFALSDYGSPYIIVLLCLEKKTKQRNPSNQLLQGLGDFLPIIFWAWLFAMKELLQKLLPSVSFKFKGLFIQQEVFSPAVFISLLHFQGNGEWLSSHYVNYTKGSSEAWGMTYISWMDKDALEELRSHLMNAWSASQVLVSKTMKRRSLYLLLLTLPQLCLEKMKVSYYEKKEETCKSRRNYILNPILLFGI